MPNWNEPVTYEDVQEQEEEVLNVLKMAHSLLVRLQNTQEDPRLVSAAMDITLRCQEAYEIAKEVSTWLALPEMR